MKPPSPPDDNNDTNKKRRRPSRTTQNVIAVLAGIATFVAGMAWVIHAWVVDREAPYFAIPLVFSVPVIVAVTIRSLWD